MSSIKFWVLVSFLATVVFVFPRGTSASQITCSDGKFEVGQTASVTCFFHRDVRASRTAFDIKARYFDSPDDTFNNIVNCNWFLNGKLYCVLQDGFVVRNKTDVSNNLTVDIPNFTEHHTGIYKCHVIDDVATTEPCYLSVYKFSQPATSDNGAYGILGGVLTVMVFLIVLVVVIYRNKKSLQRHLSRLSRRRRAQFWIVRSGSQTLADYKAESPNTTTNNHSDNTEPAQLTEPPRSRLAVASDPNAPAKRVEVPKQQFNCGLGMARKPYPIKPTEGIITRQRSFENLIFPMKELKETSFKGHARVNSKTMDRVPHTQTQDMDISE